MLSYIKITREISALVDQIDFNLSEIEVKGESVKFLFNSRMLFKQLLESVISEEDIKNNIGKGGEE